MINTPEYKALLAKFHGLVMQAEFGNQNDYLKELPKHFTEREIKILIEGNALPANYKDLLNK